VFAAPPAVPVLVALVVEAAVVVAAVPVVLALPLAVLKQTTAVGRVVTPRPPQNYFGKKYLVSPLKRSATYMRN